MVHFTVLFQSPPVAAAECWQCWWWPQWRWWRWWRSFKL